MSRKESFIFPEVRVVEASAGSGKTFALARRYVQLLLVSGAVDHDEPFRQILAVTFMKKAAFEMKGRILYFLKIIALKRFSAQEKEAVRSILSPLGMPLEEASARAFTVMERLIRQYNFFQVQTIDSFVNALLSGCAFKIGLSSRFRIRHNALEYLRYALDRLIERAAGGDPVSDLFTAFLDRYLILENKGSWFPKKDILGLLLALYSLRNSYGAEFVIHGSGGEALPEKMGRAVGLMRRLKDGLPEGGTDGRFAGSLDSFLARYTGVFDFDRVSAYFQRPEVPLRKGETCPPGLQALWEQIQTVLGEIAECEAASAFDPYVAIFQEAIREFEARAVKDDVLFMEELNRKAGALFDQGCVTPAELYYRMAARFRHYLIDEFQDTSRLQWKNIEMMIEEALSTGGSLFYVGDKKQAIYGFRGGDARLFDEVPERFAHFYLFPEYLEKNWRSYQAVVEFNNRLFSMENLECFLDRKKEHDRKIKKGSKECELVEFNDWDRDRLRAVFGHARQTFREDRMGGKVRVEHIYGRTREERDSRTREILGRTLDELSARYAWEDIVILTRTNSEVELATSWLMEKGIPVQSERTLNIRENHVIQELAAFLQFLDSPIDNRSFADFILGEVFQKACGVSGQEMQSFLFSLREPARTRRGFYIYKAFREAYPAIWDRQINGFFRHAGLYPVYEFVVSIIREFRVLENFPDAQGFVMQFLEMIRRREEESNDTASFIEYFHSPACEDVFVPVSGTDAVRVLTTHKAKGLEFPVVILPFAAMRVKAADGGSRGREEDLAQSSYVLDPAGGDLRLMRLKMPYFGYSGALYQIYRRQYVESLVSELNNVYVSLTRAEREMYVFVPEKAGSSLNLLSFLIPEGFSGTGAGGDVVRMSRREKDPAVLPVSSYRDWIRDLEEEFVADLDEPFSRQKAAMGRKRHELMAGIGILEAGNEAADPGFARACAGWPASGVTGHDGGTVELPRLEELLQKEDLRPFFYTDGAVFCEQDLVDRSGRTRRVDRMVVTESAVRILDYKSTRASDSRYHTQVTEYMDLAREIYPDKDVRGCLVYLDCFQAEEVVP